MDVAEHKNRMLKSYKEQLEENVQELEWLENEENKVAMREVHLKAYDVGLEKDLEPAVRKKMESERNALIRMLNSYDQDLVDQRIKVKVIQTLVEAMNEL